MCSAGPDWVGGLDLGAEPAECILLTQQLPKEWQQQHHLHVSSDALLELVG